MQFSKPDYKYEIQTHGGFIFLVIIDQNLGGRSVTNAIENIVEEICYQEKLKEKEVKVVYQDSDGIWDGYDTVGFFFFPCRVDTSTEAIELILKNIQHAQSKI
jgi:hypothetical protein